VRKAQKRKGSAYAHEQVDEVNVVAEVDRPEVYFFIEEFFLLGKKNLLGEIELQVLVGHVDAQLLEAVQLQVLEAGHVQDRDGRELVELVP